MDRGREGFDTNSLSADFSWGRPMLTLAAITVLAALPLVALALIVPLNLVLPAFSLAAVGAAAAIAVAAWLIRAPRGANRLTAWDVAGALAFVGIAAGMLSEPSNVLQLFGVTETF